MLQKQATILERWLEVDLEAAKRFHNNEKIFLPKLLKIQNWDPRFCTFLKAGVFGILLVFINFESIVKL